VVCILPHTFIKKPTNDGRNLVNKFDLVYQILLIFERVNLGISQALNGLSLFSGIYDVVCISVGPKLIHVLFPDPGRPISEQAPEMKRLSEQDFQVDRGECAFVLGRLRILERLHTRKRLENCG
jgi:hypothetical protein